MSETATAEKPRVEHVKLVNVRAGDLRPGDLLLANMPPLLKIVRVEAVHWQGDGGMGKPSLMHVQTEIVAPQPPDTGLGFTGNPVSERTLFIARFRHEPVQVFRTVEE